MIIIMMMIVIIIIIIIIINGDVPAQARAARIGNGLVEGVLSRPCERGEIQHLLRFKFVSF